MARENLQYQYLPVQYLPAAEHQPKCRAWVEKPTYLVQTQMSDNIWHCWNEGIGGAFQTLRELGLLPLATVVDDEGTMQ